MMRSPSVRAIALAACLAAGVPVRWVAQAAEPAWPYEDGFTEDLLHVHPEVNYALHPDWLAAWERDRLGTGAFRGAFGSTATDELLVDAQWALDPELAPGLRFRSDLLWQEQRHLPTERRDLWLGFEQRACRSIGVVVQVAPAEDKETIDLRLGGLWTAADRTSYVQVLYVLEDLVHDEKDERRGETLAAPRGVDWLLRLARGPWSLFSQGHWVRAFARTYPDPVRSPDLAAHDRAANDLAVRARWQPNARAQLELAWRQVEDAEARAYRGADSVHDHDYGGWYRVASARGVMPLGGRWRLRAELHDLRRRATASGWRAFAYRRTEIMPAVRAEWHWGGRHWIEVGYLGTRYRWRYDGEDERSGFADKVEMAVVCGLRGESVLEVSLSHEVSLDRFGGGSVRMVTRF
ncbi:MAG TPA: hypothetical protein PLL30_09455 [Candidatus Krumholzibacteria bacterium]|nr:hypothetical protein [Candidatus Krumholzibacteria bacterium]HPD71988.1 hypothetical protein [Candidatus Krumholzibacteria bacterium]HRY41079.1 hypothetical protein [Candidatus Krumholzibacteria bacterium]